MALLFVNVHRGGGGTGKNMTLALRSPKGEADPAGGGFYYSECRIFLRCFTIIVG